MPSSPTPKKRETLSVSQLNRQAKRLLEGNFPSVWVEGEISNLSRPSSGHWYFSLKDNSAQVRCAMFRSSNARLRFQAEAGQQVMARAKLSLYEARGDYQLIVEHMEPAGDGALARAFEELKNKLQAEGLFDSDIKQAIPDHPKSIAVVTSATGAAIRDILTVLARRFPSIKVSIFPTAVQGQNAAPEIARAINTANALHKSGKREFDVILAGRGGGSMEDLWAFNEEIVARAIYQSDLPVISAVGHEVDFTIADFVADLRAPTPSAAAELISPDGQEMMASFMGFEQLLTRQMLLTLETNKQQLSFLQSRLRHPGSRLQEHSQRLDELEMRLMNGWKNQSQKQQLGLQVLASRLQQQTPDHKIKQLKLSSAGLYQRLEKQVQRLLEQQQLRLKNAMQLLDAVSPLATLDRGYAIVSDDEGQVITDAEELSSGQTINTRFAKGSIKSRVN
ncbi:MAG: exodeoxyribonuclease VII large subunit [Oceanicoccus sp.]|uniref:exodeoxyribonuclease VII large subunit n=1 Tax=Oceanicoccus sp. TaxID=2691044 RepID=UPI0026359A56|nr:exodeoxyribonuclease VII large subunit [Oceanicoccus sp.]MDG1771861.1 exodeoxyribonuclease VII large subunit [Oceanicoccus sp.]